MLAVPLVFGVGVWGSSRYDVTLAIEEVAAVAGSNGTTYQPSYQRIEGNQLVLLFVGSSTCSWSADPGLPGIIEDLKVQLAGYAGRKDLGFRATAIAVDWLPEEGLRFLEPFGSFDEIAVGGNWSGHGLVRQTWDHGFSPSTPSVYILQRQLAIEDTSLGLDRLGLDQERVLLERRGLLELRELAERPPEDYLDARLNETLDGSDP